MSADGKDRNHGFRSFKDESRLGFLKLSEKPLSKLTCFQKKAVYILQNQTSIQTTACDPKPKPSF